MQEHKGTLPKVRQAAISVCHLCVPRFLYSRAEGGRQSCFNSSLENVFAVKNSRRGRIIYLLKHNRV